MRPRLVLALLTGAALAAGACGRGAPKGPGASDVAPVDTSRVHAADVAGWEYRREISADLDGDGKLDRVVIAADVAMGPTGPLWQSAHRWAVYVEPSNGERTLLYGALVPNGFAEAAVLDPDKDHRRRVLVQERTPRQVRTMEVEYDGGKARLASSMTYPVADWLPGEAAMR